VPSDQDDIARLQQEVARLGRLVDALYVRLDGIAPDGAVDAAAPPQDVVDAIRAGNKILAIKLWRGYTNLGLAEAKNDIDELERRL
jgi:ribosomal protein L7/L12